MQHFYKKSLTDFMRNRIHFHFLSDVTLRNHISSAADTDQFLEYLVIALKKKLKKTKTKKNKRHRATIRPRKHLFGSQANMSANRAGASVQGHFTQMDLALESPATASSSHLYVNTHLHTHRHTKRGRQMIRQRTSLRNLGVACRCLSVWSLWSG